MPRYLNFCKIFHSKHLPLTDEQKERKIQLEKYNETEYQQKLKEWKCKMQLFSSSNRLIIIEPPVKQKVSCQCSKCNENSYLI